MVNYPNTTPADRGRVSRAVATHKPRFSLALEFAIILRRSFSVIWIESGRGFYAPYIRQIWPYSIELVLGEPGSVVIVAPEKSLALSSEVRRIIKRIDLL